ncbi:hypothetical protein J7T55_004516 [Diaporthe amygdali]|uniref:uncharacterized protein n=1 Tax=Phomopsis amygdali TaxID=1214568 RepID=UPI0022FE363F|nr:uncharacterized protein J7T55_004516 [Diaporthe amygdali]KAJ0114775.1 hypothetical protein J7T55_004516 [Diaporthe amygdali]
MDLQRNLDSEQLSLRDAARLCCPELASTVADGKLGYPDSPEYNASLESYYSVQQESIRPACIVFPQTIQDVSDAVKVLTKHTINGLCKFAIRSGGHTSWAGASNIAGGVTLDLRGLNSIDLSEDGKTVQIGPGASWDVIYQKLDPLGRSVAGGRVPTLRPCGWSWLVLSDGTVVNANENENADLLFALRGGGNNFGIVTLIDLETYDQGLLWSASLMCDASVVESNAKEFVRLSTAHDYDEKASFLLSFAYIGSMGLSVIANTLIYADAVENPPVYQKFLKLPALQVTTGLKNMTTLSLEGEAMVPKGARSLHCTHTVISTEAMLQAIHKVWNDAVSAVRNVSGISWVLSFDPVPPCFYARHAASNALGLSGRNGAALLVLLLDVRWSEATDDETVASTAKLLFEAIKHEAQKIGAFDPFIYLNYAGPDQNPIATYGAENVQRLRAIRSRADPGELFTEQVPGGHKVPGESLIHYTRLYCVGYYIWLQGFSGFVKACMPHHCLTLSLIINTST